MDRGAISIPAHAEQYSVVLLKERGRGGFLVQRRARARGIVYAGRLGLFGGRQEQGETPEACAIREVAEESGIELRTNEIAPLARLLAHDEFGNLSFGNIFLAEEIERDQMRAAMRHRCKEGAVVRLRPEDIGARWRELTSVTSYTFKAFEDLERARQPEARGLAGLVGRFMARA